MPEHRIRLQGSIGKQVRAKKTPILQFKPDEVIRAAERIDRIIAENPVRPIGDDPPEADADATDDTSDDAPSD